MSRLEADSLDVMRSYLRRVDLVGGYIPQLAMPPRQSRLWTLFWFSVRRLDNLIDTIGVEAVRPLVDEMRAGRGAQDFQLAMVQFVTEAAPYMDSRRLVLEMLEGVEAEQRYLALGRNATPQDLFELWYHKAYIPASVGTLLLLEGEDEGEVRRYAKLVGAGFQFADDLIDLVDDVRAGLFWISAEELALLGIRRSQCLSRLRGLAQLREQICLTYFLEAYDQAARLRKARNRRLAELTIEQFFRCVQKGRFRVYTGRSKNYYGLPGLVMPRLPGPEVWKYRLFHLCIRAFSGLSLHLADMRAIRCRVDKSPLSCPAPLQPEVCLVVMEECERRWDGEAGERRPRSHIT